MRPRTLTLAAILILASCSSPHAQNAATRATRLYAALLHGGAPAGPHGFSAGATADVKLNPNDRRAGAIGGVKVVFTGANSIATIEYAVFSSDSQATRYAAAFSQRMTVSGHQRIWFLGLPQNADCASGGQTQVCSITSNNVFIIAVSTGVVTANTHEGQILRGASAGQVGKIALDHLAAVRAAHGLAAPHP